MGRWGGRHVCRPYMGDLAGVRGNKGNVRRRVKPPPYNNARLNCSNGKVDGRARPAPTAQQMGKVGDAGRVRGRHVCRPYMGDLAGVRDNKGNLRRRVKPPPYNMED